MTKSNVSGLSSRRTGIDGSLVDMIKGGHFDMKSGIDMKPEPIGAMLPEQAGAVPGTSNTERKLIGPDETDCDEPRKEIQNAKDRLKCGIENCERDFLIICDKKLGCLSFGW